MTEEMRQDTETPETVGTTENPVFPKQILAAIGEPQYTDESESNPGSGWPLLGVLGLVVAFLIWDGNRMWEHYLRTQSIWSSIDVPGVLFIVFALYYLIGQAIAVYRLELTPTAFVCTYRTLFGKRRHEIPYENIYGVHPHKARVANNVKFRYKWRWYALLDSRPMLAMFYKIPREGKLPQYGRALFKADPLFLLGMNEKLPGAVGITEEETTYRVLLDEGRLRDEREQAKAARRGGKS